jgi:alpha-galactosidase
MLSFLLGGALAINNGVGKTPPMGWNSWNHFGCSVTADILRQTTDDFVSLGLTDVGYQYINTDDCWSAKNFDVSTSTGGRSADGRIIPSSTFGNVSHIKQLSAYIRSKGMKFGIYGAAGETTCASRVGSLYHERVDAQSYADWGADYLKVRV